MIQTLWSLGSCANKGSLEYVAIQLMVRECLGEFYNLLPQLGITDLQSQIDLCNGSDGGVLPDCEGCSVGEKQIVWGDHLRAREMLQCAIDKLEGYNGETPLKVKNEMIINFGGEYSKELADLLKFILKVIKFRSSLCDYQASDDCPSGVLARSYRFLQVTKVELCRPNYWNGNDRDRSKTLIHEWMHLYYGADDFAYAWQWPKYSQLSAVKQFLNADSFAEFVKWVCNE